ncbi:MAG TPA: metallophosphoesterase family protein [Spirillospora sp.]|nr:metallophosphoesterase family protein [Spirillospora sp.]
MTRLAILADIHGNLPALEAVIADMAHFQPDHVIVAGDLINVGPFSAQVMQRVSELGWTAIRGNHEYYLLEYNTPRAPESRRDWVTLPFLYEQLAGRWYNLIAAMPDELTLYYPDGPPIRVLHGLPGNPWEALHRLSTDDAVCAALDGVAEATVISGHYHLSFEKRVNGWHVLNPGSLGVPMDGLQDAGYLLLDSTGSGWQPTFRRVPVDYAPLYAEFERQRFVEQCGVIGYLIVQQFRWARTVINAFYRWHAATCPDQTPSIDLVDRFLASGDLWTYTNAPYRYNRHLLP